MIDLDKLITIDPSSPNIKELIPKEKGIYFWFDKTTDELMYIGTGSGVKGLYNRIIGQHLNPKYIEYRAKVHNKEKDKFQLENPIIRERDGAPGIDQSAFRKNIGRTFKIKPGIHTVNYIKENLVLKYKLIDGREELMILEKKLILKLKPKLNISHKYKISNKLY
uniref:GIY-YIG nuclease family protein n=1 Tax=uncultured Polaribacter sp. TaxID=174711 RepID=UPI00260D49D7|nr:hypothetical protein [uncultured Polaribacter sp.]